MKIIITENKLEKALKQSGTKKTIDILGGWDNFCKIYKIETPMDFLHLFDDLEQVQSEQYRNNTLFRHKKGNNLMVYDRKSKEVYIDYDEIWSFLEDKFDLTFSVAQAVTKKWLDEVYNLSEITPYKEKVNLTFRLDEVYNLK